MRFGWELGTDQTVQLVRDGRGEDGLIGPVDGRGQVVVTVRVVNPDEAHADCGLASATTQYDNK